MKNIVKQIPVYLLAVVFAGFGLAYYFKWMPESELSGDLLTYVNLM